MLKSADIIAVLDRVADPSSDTKAFRRYTYLGVPLAVDIKRINPSPLMVPPGVKDALEDRPVQGVVIREMLHNTNFREFPKRLNTGADEINFGYRLDVANEQALDSLLAALARTPLVGEGDALPPDVASASETERQSLILARRGQGVFRDKLDAVWDSACALTNISVRTLLRASHIKPWRVSTNTERLSRNNGLLLTATLDAAFDAGLLTFMDDGAAKIADISGPPLLELLGLQEGAKLRKPLNELQKTFLFYHRQHVFNGLAKG